MEYCALTVGLANELFSQLQAQLIPHHFHFTASMTMQEASRKLTGNTFQLLILGLTYLQSTRQTNWIASVRRASTVPILVLARRPEQSTGPVVQLGADLCVSDQYPPAVLAALALALLRRYTEYDHACDAETAAFQIGDIWIDPACRAVEVRGRPVVLRPREFELLLYFMRNPGVVLTTEQICDDAWGIDGGYNRGISGPIAVLRKAIEPDAAHPCYIETVHRVGYRFTAHYDETCDKCSSFEGTL